MRSNFRLLLIHFWHAFNPLETPLALKPASRLSLSLRLSAQFSSCVSPCQFRGDSPLLIALSDLPSIFPFHFAVPIVRLFVLHLTREWKLNKYSSTCIRTSETSPKSTDGTSPFPLSTLHSLENAWTMNQIRRQRSAREGGEGASAAHSETASIRDERGTLTRIYWYTRTWGRAGILKVGHRVQGQRVRVTGNRAV